MPHCLHSEPPLQEPFRYDCVGKQSLFMVMILANTLCGRIGGYLMVIRVVGLHIVTAEFYGI